MFLDHFTDDITETQKGPETFLVAFPRDLSEAPTFHSAYCPGLNGDPQNTCPLEPANVPLFGKYSDIIKVTVKTRPSSIRTGSKSNEYPYKRWKRMHKEKAVRKKAEPA